MQTYHDQKSRLLSSPIVPESPGGLGVLLGIMILSAGTHLATLCGWIAAFLLVALLKNNNTNYFKLYLSGVLCYSLGLYWMWGMIEKLSTLSFLYVSLFFLLFVLIQSVYLPAIFLVYRLLPNFLDKLNLRAAFAVTTMECLPVQLFPWKFGHSQWTFHLFIQLAELGGVIALSFFMIVLADFILTNSKNHNYGTSLQLPYSNRLVVGVTFFLSIISIFGYWRILKFTPVNAELLTISQVQPNQRLNSDTPPLKKLVNLTHKLSSKSELVIWPEESLPFRLHESVFQRSNEPRLPQFPEKFDLLVGTKTFRRPDRVFNSAVLVKADGRIPLPYHKQKPIPFGEYIPFEEIFPFLRLVNPAAKGLFKGDKQVLFEIADRTQKSKIKALLAPIICYEEIFPAFSREAVMKGANVIASLTDDSWYDTDTRTILRQHFVLSAFRAIETRRTLIRTATTGITAVIGPTGTIMNSLEPGTEGILTTPVPILDYMTLYCLLGGDKLWRALSLALVSLSVLSLLLRYSRLAS